MANKHHIDSLDSLRGIAALVVVIFHCLISFPLFFNANYERKYVNSAIELFTVTPIHTIWAGREAVILFFMLSGFVLSIPFFNNMTPRYLVFITKRFFRIYVPYIIIMIFVAILMTLFASFHEFNNMSLSQNSRWNHPASLYSLIATVAMLDYDTLNINGVIWSLFHEMRISLFFPFLMLLIIKRNWVKITLLAFGTSIASFVLVYFSTKLSIDGALLFLLKQICDTLYYTSFFIIGALLSKCIPEISNIVKPLNKINKGFLFLMSLILLNYRWIYYFTGFKYYMIEDFITASGFVILLILVLNSNTADKFLVKKPFLFLGKISYSLYLLHIPITMLLSIHLSKFLPMWFSIMLVPVISIPVAYLSYRFIELPSINIGKKLSSQLNNILTNSKKEPFYKLQQKNDIK